MNMITVSGIVKGFDGKYGWYYVELDEDLSKDLRPLLKDRWPALLNASFTVNDTLEQFYHANQRRPAIHRSARKSQKS